MSQAFLSWITLCSEDPDLTGMKVASVFFDELILDVSPSDSLYQVLDGLVEDKKVTRETADHLRRIWVPIEAVLPGVDIRHPLNWGAKELERAALKVVLDSEREEYNVDESVPGFHHEVAWAYRGLVAAVVKWGALNAQQACTFLANRRESSVVQQVFQKTQPPEATRVFRQVLESRIPDMRALPWERILDLRSHAFLEHFRRKITELVTALRSDVEHTIVESVREIELHDLSKLVRLVEPSPRKTILKFIASNFPLPIPVNPASVGIGLKEIKEAYERKEQFGWLYFLMDLTGK